jgi:hypothetical protein
MPATPTAPVTLDRGRAPVARGRRQLPSWVLALISALGGVLAVALLVLRLMSGDPETAATGPGEIFLEPAAATGPDPFTPSVASTTTATPPPASPTATASPSAEASSVPGASASPGAATAIQATAGGTVGLYGGTRNNAECDMEQLVGFLEANPDKARAWAAVHGIEPSAIRDFVDGLTPVVLQRDTRVTNHGFRDGVADARQSVLQAGTAVLVDRFGVPRARCFCGNPLLEPIPAQVAPTYTGDAWPGFAPNDVTVIAPAAAPLAEIPVVDLATGEVFVQQTGSDGTTDTGLGASPSPPASSEPTPPTATESPTATALPGPGEGEPVTRDPVFDSDLTAIGAVGANSVDPNFPVGLAVDLDSTTSWFSIGPHSRSTVTDYTWSVDGPVEIGAVVIVGNAENATTAFRTGFGFARVDVEVLFGDVVVATSTLTLDGTPDPDVYAEFPAGTMGDTVRLRFSGHESLDCGGIGEILVLGSGWQADIERAIEEGLGNLFGS